MSHRLAIAAVIAHDGRLDDARAIGVRAGRDCERKVRRVRGVREVQWVRKVRGFACVTSLHPRDGVADERAEFVLGHS